MRTVGLYACSFLPCLQQSQQCYSCGGFNTPTLASGLLIPHALHKLRLRCLNGKKAIAAIPNAVQELTSLYIAQRQVFLTKNLLLSGTTAIHGSSELDILVNSWTRVFCKQKTSLLFRTSGIRATSEYTSLYTGVSMV